MALRFVRLLRSKPSATSKSNSDQSSTCLMVATPKASGEIIINKGTWYFTNICSRDLQLIYLYMFKFVFNYANLSVSQHVRKVWSRCWSMCAILCLHPGIQSFNMLSPHISVQVHSWPFRFRVQLTRFLHVLLTPLPFFLQRFWWLNHISSHFLVTLWFIGADGYLTWGNLTWQ